MNKTTLSFFIIFMTFFSFSYTSSSMAATYYVDASAGSDSKTGQSPELAWKSVAKVNASKFLPGDKILFKRGEIWREMLIPSSSGTESTLIIYDAYGSGNDPIISGADVVTNWQQQNGNIWKANIGKEPKVVLFNKKYGVNKADVSKLNAPNEWIWRDSTLYVYSLSDPSSLF